jgi:hypothetical protein
LPAKSHISYVYLHEKKTQQHIFSFDRTDSATGDLAALYIDGGGLRAGWP